MLKRIHFFFLSYLVATGYSQTLIWLWFLQHNVSYLQMILAALCNFSLSIPLYFILNGKKWKSRTLMPIGIASSAFAVFIASMMTEPWHAILACSFFALPNVFFWTVYNTMHFKFSADKERGHHTGLYALLFPISAAIVAPLAGFITEKFGFSTLFISGLIFYLVPFTFSFFMPSFDFHFNTKEAFEKMENKAIIFFQGYNGMLGLTFIPIFTLFFITTPSSLGKFFGYLALLSAVVAFINSKMSDAHVSRVRFFYIFAILNSFSFLPMLLVKTLLGWQIFTGINKVTSSFINPFDFALILDHAKQDVGSTMIGREIFLNLGRACMIMVSIFVLIATGSFFTVMVISAFIAMIYPLIAYYKKAYLR